MNYNSTVSKLRVIARDILRLTTVNRYRDERLTLTNALASLTKHFDENMANIKKAIARLEFSLSKLETADPDYEQSKESMEADIKDYNEYMAKETESYVKREQECKEAIAKVDEKITNVQDGKVKVDRDNLSATTRDLIQNFGNEKLKEELENMPEEDMDTEEVEDENEPND